MCRVAAPAPPPRTCCATSGRVGVGNRVNMPVRFYQIGSFAAGNRLAARSSSSVQADPGRANSLNSGHRACQGCGEALGARFALDAAMRATGGRHDRGERDRMSGGVLDAVPRDVLADCVAALAVRQRPRGGDRAWRLLCGPRDVSDVRVVAQAGDGGTVDIGFGCLSGMFERNDDVLFICYDNEAYMNTGVQRSSATPPAARTATTEAVGPDPGIAFGQGKNLPAFGHGPRDPLCGHRHGGRPPRPGGQGRHGPWPSAGPATSTCWSRARSAGAPRRATRCGSPGWPPRPASSRSSKPSSARWSRVSKIRRPAPVNEYLRLQARFAHLFEADGGLARPDIVAAFRPWPTGTSAATAWRATPEGST